MCHCALNGGPINFQNADTVLDVKYQSRHHTKTTNSKNSKDQSHLNDLSLIRDLILRVQLVGTKNACHSNKSS